MSGFFIAELDVCLIRLFYTSAARDIVCSSVRSERFVFPLTVITPRGPGIELEVCIMRYRIEFGECGSSEQCMIATAEGDDIED